LREVDGRQFHREGPITVKDLDLTIVALAQGTKGCWDVYSKSEEGLEMWQRRELFFLIANPTFR